MKDGENEAKMQTATIGMKKRLSAEMGKAVASEQLARFAFSQQEIDSVD
jgi:hypothetical protein